MIPVRRIVLSVVLSVVMGASSLPLYPSIPVLPLQEPAEEVVAAWLSDQEEPAEPEEVRELHDVDPYEVDLLARLIYHEAGCDWIPDYVILWVGSVALNRVASDLYPDTLHEVVFQPGQYGPAISGSINLPANERCYMLAEQLLRDGSLLPPDVLGQCGWPTGRAVYATYYDEVLGTTIYFCHIG